MKRACIIVYCCLCLLPIVLIVVMRVWLPKVNQSKNMTLCFPDGRIEIGDDIQQWMVSSSLIEAISGFYDVPIHIDSEHGIIFLNEREEDLSGDVSLLPYEGEDRLVIHERELYGDWLGGGNTDEVYGYQFTSTDLFGPYTAIEIFGRLSDETGVRDVTRMGFYEITEAGVLKLHFKRVLFADTGESEVIDDTELWSVAKNETTITLSQESKAISMIKIIAGQ